MKKVGKSNDNTFQKKDDKSERSINLNVQMEINENSEILENSNPSIVSGNMSSRSSPIPIFNQSGEIKNIDLNTANVFNILGINLEINLEKDIEEKYNKKK